jgi:hypothetical protein
MNRSLFPTTLDSVLQHREVGRVKDLSAPLVNDVSSLAWQNTLFLMKAARAEKYLNAINI